MKDKGEDFESCESINARTLSPMKVKARTLSPMKNKSEDFESYKTRALVPKGL